MNRGETVILNVSSRHCPATINTHCIPIYHTICQLLYSTSLMNAASKRPPGPPREI